MNRKLLQYSYSSRLQFRHNVFYGFLYIVLIFTVINLLLTYVIFPVYEKSVSMIPDVEKNSFVMVTPLASRYNRGDVVLLKSRTPDNRSRMSRLANLAVKFFTLQQFSLTEKRSFPGTNLQLRRIVALPGDSIYMRDYVLYIKPAGEKYYLTEFEVSKKPYNVTFFTAPAEWDSSLGVKGSFDEIVLASDEYFVLGDNRKSTQDSRLYGPIKLSSVRAKALFCYFPFNKIRLY